MRDQSCNISRLFGKLNIRLARAVSINITVNWTRVHFFIFIGFFYCSLILSFHYIVTCNCPNYYHTCNNTNSYCNNLPCWKLNWRSRCCRYICCYICCSIWISSSTRCSSCCPRWLYSINKLSFRGTYCWSKSKLIICNIKLNVVASHCWLAKSPKIFVNWNSKYTFITTYRNDIVLRKYFNPITSKSDFYYRQFWTVCSAWKYTVCLTYKLNTSQDITYDWIDVGWRSRKICPTRVTDS